MYYLFVLASLMALNRQVFASGYIGPGTWQIVNVQRCENPESYPLKIDVTRRKINRTHDGFDAHFSIPYVINDVALEVVVCKNVDGGCKHYLTIMEQSLESMCKKFVANNTRAILDLAGFNPNWFPLSPGEYDMKQYIFNYEELYDEGDYGNYDAVIYFIKGVDKITCLQANCEFTEND